MGISPRIITLTDASGAFWAAGQGMLVVVVDVIDMSTTLEAALEAGASMVLGASPDFSSAPVTLDPYRIGLYGAEQAAMFSTSVVVISEPRVGSEADRSARCQKLLAGIKAGNGQMDGIFPNLGAETPRLIELKNKVVIAATDTGGVAFDAAFQVAPTRVTVGTIARTLGKRGRQPVEACLERVRQMVIETSAAGIAVVAASRNSLEDVLASNYIATQFMMGFTN
ncbi:MAG: hypothetical protein ACM3O9_00120 [Methylocystaceae bacterium]